LFSALPVPLGIAGVFRAAVHPAAAAGQTISVFAANVMFPLSLTLKRVDIARSAANAGDAAASTASSDPTAHAARRNRRTSSARRLIPVHQGLVSAVRDLMPVPLS